MKKFFIGLVATLTIGFAAGCGGKDENAEYVKKVNNAFAQFGNQLTAIAGSITESSEHSSDVRTMHKAADDLRDLSRALSGIKPPKDEQSSHQQLQQEINQFATSVENSAGQSTAAFETQVKLVITQVQNTINDINN